MDGYHVLRCHGKGPKSKVRVLLLILSAYWCAFASGYDSLEASLVRSVLASNPGLAVFSSDSAADEASARAVSALPFPQVSIESMQELDGVKRMQTDFVLSQELPFPGTRPKKEGAMRARAAVAGASRRVLARSLVAETKRKLAELAFAWRKQEINDSAILELSSASKVISSRYRSGLAQLSEQCAIDAELALIRADSAQTSAEIGSAQARIAGLAGRPVSLDIRPFDQQTYTIREISADSLVSLALTSPVLLKMEAVVDADMADLGAEKRKAAPDIMLKGTYRSVSEGADQWGIMLGATIPESWSWRAVSASKSEKELIVRRDKADLDDARARTVTELRARAFTYSGWIARLNAIRSGSVPLAAKALSAAEAAYGEGLIDFSSCIAADRTLRAAMMDEAETIMKIREAMAEICEITGSYER